MLCTHLMKAGTRLMKKTLNFWFPPSRDQPQACCRKWNAQECSSCLGINMGHFYWWNPPGFCPLPLSYAHDPKRSHGFPDLWILRGDCACVAHPYLLQVAAFPPCLPSVLPHLINPPAWAGGGKACSFRGWVNSGWWGGGRKKGMWGYWLDPICILHLRLISSTENIILTSCLISASTSPLFPNLEKKLCVHDYHCSTVVTKYFTGCG